MGVIEIVLIVLGVVVFIGSFLLPAGQGAQVQISEQLNEETIREMVEKELEEAKRQIGDIVDETITYAIEKTERSMDRLTNEKMMAVNEYSDTVLEEINKNHKEVVFLYDMLNDKHENVKNTVSEVDKKVSEVKQTVKDVEILAKEVGSSAEEAVSAVRTAPAAQVSLATASESIIAKPEFKPMEAPKIDVVYRPMSAEKPEVGSAGDEKTGQMKGMGDVKAQEGMQVEKPMNIVENVTENVSLNSVSSMTDAKVEHTSASVSTGDKAGTSDMEVTLDAAGHAGNRNSNERILELHKMGKSNMAIAKELRLGIGEVKLVIDLFEGQ